MKTNKELKHDIFLCTVIKIKLCYFSLRGYMIVSISLNTETRCSVNNKTFLLFLMGLIALANILQYKTIFEQKYYFNLLLLVKSSYC